MACLLAVVGFAVVYRFFPEGTVFPFSVYLQEAVLIWLGQAVVYLLHLALSLRFGKTVSIGVGTAGSLLAFLMLTGLGDGIWMFFPWAWSCRGCSYLLLYAAGSGPNFTLNPSVKMGGIFCLVMDVMKGFGLGADDYIRKPFGVGGAAGQSAGPHPPGKTGEEKFRHRGGRSFLSEGETGGIRRRGNYADAGGVCDL